MSSAIDFSEQSKQTLPKNLAQLKAMGWQSRTVKEEVRQNLTIRLKEGKKIFSDIYGYEKTVELQVINALLSMHNFILLGLRGQGKTKIIREIPKLLDAYSPCIAGLPLGEDPLKPISPRGKAMAGEMGDDLPIEWRTRDERFKEKLATPDVSIADLIGDIDPIKAAREKLDISNEEVIHWGIVPRSNRGVFAINELPDLQPRIQVGLFNILEENDIQVRGFPLRVPMDILLLFSANPEDYTNRGRIITPLKDRINSQIITHYPKGIAVAKQITASQVNIKQEFSMPEILKCIVERITMVARESELVDPMSGVSQRLSIAAYEMIMANAERRFLADAGCKQLRLMDVYAAVPAITGKIELIEERSQEDLMKLGTSLIGEAVRKVFGELFPALGRNAIKRLHKSIDDENGETAFDTRYIPIVEFFKKGGKIEALENMNDHDFYQVFFSVPGMNAFLKSLKRRTAEKNNREEEEKLKKHYAQYILKPSDENLLAELLIEGLHQHQLVSRKVEDGQIIFQDVYSKMFSSFL